MFTREHFPLVLRQAIGHNERKFWDFSRIEIPPYHPFMKQGGINFKSVPELVYDAVEATVKDLEEIADKRSDVQAILRDIFKGGETGRVLFEPRVIEQNDLGITLDSVPIVSHLYVGKNEINPYGYHGDQGISINPESAAPSFAVPVGVAFSPELMREYEMADSGLFLGKRQIKCPNGWYRHNLDTANSIFYKNLVVALDNSVVTERYQKKPAS